MSDLESEARASKHHKQQQIAQAKGVAAFFLAVGIDLSEALAAEPDSRERIRMRVARLIERERLRGLRRHWSYDLNRHIALKQALDQLRNN